MKEGKDSAEILSREPPDTGESPPKGTEGLGLRSLQHELRRGWIPLLAVFGVNMLLIGYGRIFGVLYVAMREMFRSSATATSWVAGLQTLLRMCLGPIAGIIISKWRLRPVALLGAVLISAGAVGSSFAGNLVAMYLTYSVLIGIGGCLVYIASFIVINQHFDEHKAFAYGFTNVGFSIGLFLLPLLANYLMEEYNVAGFLLIFGGIMMHIIVCAALFKDYTKTTDTVLVDDITPYTTDINQNKSPGYLVKLNQKDLLNDLNAQPALSVLSRSTASLPVHRKLSTLLDLSSSSRSIYFEEFGSVLITGEKERDSHTCPQFKGLRQRSMSEDEGRFQTQNSRSPMTLEKYVSPENADQRKRTCPNILATCCSSQSCTQISRLFQNPEFVTFCFLSVCQTQVLGGYSAFIVALAREKGIASARAVGLISISGLSDLIGNLLLPAIFDLRCVKVYRVAFYIGLCFLSGATMVVLPFCQGYAVLVIFVVSHSIVASQLHTLRIPAIMEVIPTLDEVLPTALGCLTFCMGAGHALAATLGGSLRDFSGNYNLTFCVIGSLLVGASLLFMSVHLIKKHKRKDRLKLTVDTK